MQETERSLTTDTHAPYWIKLMIPWLLAANDLALAYGHQSLLQSVTLSVAPGEKVGCNGCRQDQAAAHRAPHAAAREKRNCYEAP